MSLDLGVFCKSTLDGELVEHCYSAVFGLAKNSDPSYLDWLMKAWSWTLAVAGLSLIIALILGAVMGTLRTLPKDRVLDRWLVRLATAWVELFRNIPILVQVFLWYHVIPALIPPLKMLPSYWLVSIALGFFTSARIAERTACRRYRPWLEYCANLSLCHSPYGLEDCDSSPYLGVYESH